MGCEDDKVCQSSTKGAQEETGVICCGCGAVFSVAGAPVVRSCSLLQLSVMLKMPWLGKLPVGESSLGSMP